MKRLINYLLAALLLFAATTARAEGVLPPQANAGKTISLTTAEFQKYVFNYTKNPSAWSYEGALPCIIDFYADWCGPCRNLAPILSEIARDYKGKLLVYKVDVEKQKELAQLLGIQALPTIMLVPAKGDPWVVKGYRPKADLEHIIAEALGIEPQELVEM